VRIAGKLPVKRTSALLRIMLDDPDIPELRVPLLLQGQAEPPQDAAPTEATQEAPDHEAEK
jgi:hypothetical protein